MRLTENEIQYISRKIVKTLVAEGKLQVDAEEPVVEGIAQTITGELALEDRLNEEVREVLVHPWTATTVTADSLVRHGGD